ncbi:unnamed protein product [Miscanthus lutarioriparius]|uniref:Tryptophanyl-tRNA synthetase n=1 Tax=Miscanthus lutarioriparius TaxID=422564 RepID=A0A811SF16_9POAL|nr:unnamed protein product [Miscanthus lutarioriparius]
MAAAEQGVDAARKEEEEEEEQVVNPWEVSAGRAASTTTSSWTSSAASASTTHSSAASHASPDDRRTASSAEASSSPTGEKFYLYTGRGPRRRPCTSATSSLHVHKNLSSDTCRRLLRCPLVIQLTDDEKFLWKNLTIQESKRLARENAKDIIACGFDIERTFIFSDFSFVGGAFYENMMQVARCVTMNKAIGIFGFNLEDHIGKVSFPPVQTVPSFPSSFPHLFAGKDQLMCLIPCAIDQVNKYAFSGGQDSIELHRKLGANLDEYKEGRMLTGEVKQRLIAVLSEIVARHQRARSQVTEEMVDAFMAVRPLPNMFG